MADRLKGRYGYPEDKPFRPTFHGDRLLEPYYLKKPSKIFSVSMGEIFDRKVPDIWRDLVFQVMWYCDQHIFQVLTKQADRLHYCRMNEEEYVPPNLWLGVSQDGKTTDIKQVMDLFEDTITPVRFVSCEPLLGPIDFEGEFGEAYMDWIIIGAQSVPGKDPIQPKKEWVQDIIDFARRNEVPIFLKDNLKWSEKIQEYPDKKYWRRTW